MKVATKTDSYRLYEQGKFGNKLRTWGSLAEISASGYSGRIVMRYKGRAGGAKYPNLGVHITLKEARANLAEWRRLGAVESEVAYNEAAPDDRLLLQGEVALSTEHLSLFWSDEKTTMRRALDNGKQWYGLRALMLLKAKLYPSSWADMEALFERFPDSVIEFSAYCMEIGCIKGRNAVIWEVRNY